MSDPYEMGDLGSAARRDAPAARRNVDAIGDVLAEWLPGEGLVLEVASGTGQHALAFAKRFPNLSWQPSDPDPDALVSIAAWSEGGPDNLRAPLRIDAASRDWPVEEAAAVLCTNMAHISAWEATLGLLEGAVRLLATGRPLIFYGPWYEEGVEPAPSNRDFDASLKSRDPRWGIRTVEVLAAAATERGFSLEERRTMPANNMMLRLVKL